MMDAKRWDEVCELLADALERPENEREVWLAEACSDEIVRREVLSLLAQDATALAAVDAAPGRFLSRAVEPNVGARVGPYRLIEEIGRGGMGVVFLAERIDGELERRVALKVLRDGLGRDFVGRFRVERQILAQLDHPNVAELYESGVTESGSPYFTMELVRGERLDRWCDARRLPIRARLELFITLARAVAHAHRNLVVHRDLKPGNILVREDGVAKLLDFGIAKLLDADGGAAITLTAPGARPMTPEYASPEQVTDRPITTATDVHALGVLLYELLTGVRPFRVRRSSSFEELRRTICEGEPTRPSVAVVRSNRDDTTVDIAGDIASEPTPEERALARSSRPRSLRREMRGDLDNIVAMALGGGREPRYASATELADDLERHLEGRPVRARRPTLSYRAGKFVRRNALRLAAAALLGVVLGAWVVDREGQRRETERALARSERVTELMLELFEVSDPAQAGDAITAADVLDRGAERIRSDLVGDPRLRGSLLAAIGRAHHGLGLYDRAEAYLTEGLALQRREERSSEAAVGSLTALGRVRLARGELDAAESTLRQALASSLALGRDPVEIARVRRALADVLLARGETETAREMYRQVAEIRSRRLDPDHPERIESLNDLASERLTNGDREAAEKLFREVLERRRRVFGPRHPEVAKSLSNLSITLWNRGFDEEVEALLRETLSIHLEVYGPGHPDSLKSASILGQFLAGLGRMDEAEPLLRESLEHQRDLLGEDHPEVIDSARELAVLLYRTGSHAEALALLDPAIESARQTHGPEHRKLASLLNNRGSVLLALEAYDEAAMSFEEAIEVFAVALGPESVEASSSLHNLGGLHRARGDEEKAESFYRRALEIRRRAGSEKSTRVANTQVRLARLLVETGRVEEGAAMAGDALSTYRELLPSGHWRTVIAECALGAARIHEGRLDEAEILLHAARDRLRELPEVRPAVRERLASDLDALDEARAKKSRWR